MRNFTSTGIHLFMSAATLSRAVTSVLHIVSDSIGWTVMIKGCVAYSRMVGGVAVTGTGARLTYPTGTSVPNSLTDSGHDPVSMVSLSITVTSLRGPVPRSAS